LISKWKEKKARKLEALALQKQQEQNERLLREHKIAYLKQEQERERIRTYNRVWRKAHLQETAARQRRWRAKKKAKSNNENNNLDQIVTSTLNPHQQ
jgi:hypothetical protein